MKKTDVGVDNLRVKLSHQQQRHFRNEIPKVQVEIAQELEECNRELESLGQVKEIEEQMRVELQRLCGESSKLIDLAVEGNYKDPNFFPAPSSGRKLQWKDYGYLWLNRTVNLLMISAISDER